METNVRSPVKSVAVHMMSNVRDGTLDANRTRMLVQEEIGKDWKRLARELRIPETTLDRIEIDCRSLGVREMCAQVLKEWHQDQQDGFNHEFLIQSLKKIKRCDIVNEILNPQDYMDSAFNDSGNDLLKAVKQKLKAFYSNLKMRGLPWMDEIELNLKDYYVDMSLKLNSTELQCRPIKLEQIFTVMKSRETMKPSRILLEGAMGYGKTVLSSKLCFDWAQNEKYLRCFDLVFFFPLRNFDNNLNEMLFRATQLAEKNRFRFEQLMEDKSKQILIVLDGLDELQPSYKGHILPVLKRDILNHVTVAATSRPGQYSSDKHNITWFRQKTGVDIDTDGSLWDRNITILGISEKMQMKFVNKYLIKCSSEKRESVLYQLKLAVCNNLLPTEFLKSPLFLLMIILIESQNKALLQVKTKTDLYKLVFNFVLRRYLVVKKDYSSEEEVDMFNFWVTPSFMEPMVQFGQLSLNALKFDKLFFHKDELPVCNGVCEVAEIGFLTKNVSQDGLESKVTYEPIHKSLMEFAAAYNLWLSLTKGPRECWDDHLSLLVKLRPRYKSDSASFLFLFLAGLLGKDATCLFNVLKPFASEYNEWFGSLSYSLMETELTNTGKESCNVDAVLNSLHTLLPNTWLVPWDDDHGFSTSAQHATIIQLGVDSCKIKVIKWNVHKERAFPKDLKTRTLIAEFTEPTAPVFSCSKNKLSCKSLLVSVPYAITNVQGFQDVIQAVEFENMSVCLCNDASVVKFSYKDVPTAKAEVENSMIYLCGLHIKYLQIFLLSRLTTLVRQDALKTLDMKLKPQETDVLFSFFSFIILCCLMSTMFSHYVSTICLFFIFSAMSGHVDGSVDLIVIKCISLLSRILPHSVYAYLTKRVCLVITVMLLFLITHILFTQVWSLYRFLVCISIVCFIPQNNHINIVVKSFVFVMVNHYLLELYSLKSIVNSCLLIYSMFCINFSYHMFLLLSDVCGANLTFLYFIIFLSLPFFIPVLYSIALVVVMYLGFVSLVVLYPTLGLFQYLHVSNQSNYRSYYPKGNLSPNDRIHNFFKNFLVCSLSSLLFHSVVYILFSFSSVGHMRDYVCPLLPLLPSLFPSFVFSKLCKLIRCKQVSEKHFSELIKCAGTSTNLQQFILGNHYSLGWFPQLFFLFAVDLSELCNRGLKSWHWLQLEDVEIRGRQNIENDFEIKHFDFSKADLRFSDEFFRFCHLTSLVCRSSFLNANANLWSNQKHSLKELYIFLDESFSIVPEMQNLKVFAVTITRPSSTSISFSLENIINDKQLMAFEVWDIENNYYLTLSLIENIVTMLEIRMDHVPEKLHSSYKPFKYSKLERLVLLTNITPDAQFARSSYSSGFAAVHNLLKCTLCLKNVLLEKSLLQLDIVCCREVVHYMSANKSNEIAGSWVEAFPPQEGYVVTHDLWGTADKDSIRSKGLAHQFPDRYHRFSIRIKEASTLTKSESSADK